MTEQQGVEVLQALADSLAAQESVRVLLHDTFILLLAILFFAMLNTLGKRS